MAAPYDAIRAKMEAAAVARPAIIAFLDAVQRVSQGETGLLPEADIEPLTSAPRFDDLPEPNDADVPLLDELAVINLNGGLGTGMGLAGPKSLLVVREDETFLDLIARQILDLRRSTGRDRPACLFMNSYSTRAESNAALEKYGDLPNADGSLDFVQNRVPKLNPETLLPVDWPADRSLEWCPPGHGDLYPSLLSNDHLLQRLLEGGIRYLFVSNVDNLGATVDLRLLRYFADSGLSFLMEVAQRTESDRKGGHLARRLVDDRLVLRESAQCPVGDLDHFQNIDRHQFFNHEQSLDSARRSSRCSRCGRRYDFTPSHSQRQNCRPARPTVVARHSVRIGDGGGHRIVRSLGGHPHTASPVRPGQNDQRFTRRSFRCVCHGREQHRLTTRR